MIDETLSTLGSVEVNALLPLITLGLGVLVLLLQVAFFRSLRLTFLVFTTILIVAFMVTLWIQPTRISDILNMDDQALLGVRLILLLVLPIGFFAYDGLKQIKEMREEFFILFLIMLMGAVLVCMSNHFVTLFLGLELLSLPAYVLVAYHCYTRKALEAGYKYLVLSAISGAFILYGISFLYAWSGTLQFDQILEVLDELLIQNQKLFLLGCAFFLVGVAFKLALFPFHFWAPDVYEGSMASVGLWINTLSKGAVLVAASRFLEQVNLGLSEEVTELLLALSVLSLWGGSVLAVFQRNIRRLLAYSGTAHMGFIFSFLALPVKASAELIWTYLFLYTLTSVVIFGVLSIMENEGYPKSKLEDFRSFSFEHPFLGFFFACALFSLMGFPLTAGFYTKWLAMTAALEGHSLFLFFSMLCASGILIYAYLRVLIALYAKRPDKMVLTVYGPSALSKASRGVVAIFGVLMIFLGFFPKILFF